MLLHEILDWSGTNVFEAVIGHRTNELKNEFEGLVGVQTIDEFRHSLACPEILWLARQGVPNVGVN
ncbi:MAG TPA: hypothetical protein VK922_10800 [Gemmatimonadaceae bacterium]|nr:hypothetical protein [Gemmatimonadaceae bacterium]